MSPPRRPILASVLPWTVSAALAVLALWPLGCGGGGGGGTGTPDDDGLGPYGLSTRVPVTTLTFPTAPPSASGVASVDAFPSLPSFAAPVLVTHAPGDASRLFVVEQRGRIRVFPNAPSATAYATFLDVTDRATAAMGEEGLLGLAFHPDYANNRTFYVYYTPASGPRRSVISRFRVTGTNPDDADEASEVEVLSFLQPYSNHNGGMIAFGPDGFLYAGTGDGGSGGDPENRALDTTQLLGKFLRIAVDPNAAAGVYSIPEDNPFASSTGPERKEIWAWGMRNPWRWSFDRVSARLWCGDVGQGAREEIDVIEGGKNYGWRALEGTRTNSPSDLSRGPFTAPVVEYGRAAGTCVVGGHVYRGTGVPALYGSYLYADHGSGTVWALGFDGTSVTSNVEIETLDSPSSFGEDAAGEVYVCEYWAGRLRKFVPAPNSAVTFPQTLSATGIYDDLQTLAPNPGLVPYDVNAPLWSDGAEKHRLLALPGSSRITWSAGGAFGFPAGTVLVKTFLLPLVQGDPSSAVKVETRALVLTANGWDGYSYRWRDDQTDADLLGGAAAKTFSIDDSSAPGGTREQTWTFPSRGACLACHTEAAGRILGLTTRQLNRAYDYPSPGGGTVTDNQLRSWNHIGLFTTSLPAASTLPAHARPDDPGAPVAARARAWLDANCSMCHRSGGPTAAAIDLRSTVTVGEMNVVGVPPQHGGMGLSSPLLVASGDRSGSVLWLRITSLGPERMPPLASSVVDPVGSSVVGQWIDEGP